MAGGAWSDLLPRLGTAIILACVAAGALITGGMVFAAFLLIAVALMHWELGQMLNPMSRQSGASLQPLPQAPFFCDDDRLIGLVDDFYSPWCLLPAFVFHKLKRSGLRFLWPYC